MTFVNIISFLFQRCNEKEYTLKMYSVHKWPYKENTRFGEISADHLDGDKIAYIEQACEIDGNLIITCNRRDYRATMKTPIPYYQRKEKGVIFIGMSKQDARNLNSAAEFEVQIKAKFELKYSYFDRLHQAIDLISRSTLHRLFPSSASSFSKPQKHPELPLSIRYRQFLTLDHSQREALEKIVYAEPKAPVIVAGSFGTGKTQMLAQAAFQIFTAKYKERPRVLVCAHHQASADSFLTKYFGPMKEENGWKVSITRMMQYHKIKKVEECYQKYCKTAYDVANQFHRFQLVISTFGITLNLAQKLLKRKSYHNGWFTHILIDEGAQTREPETITPLSLCGPTTVIAIAGDHKQVKRFQNCIMSN